MSGGGSGGGTTTQNTIAQPPAYLEPYLQKAASNAQGVYQQGMPQYYPGQTVANFTPAQQAAQGATLNYTLGNTPQNEAASGYLTNKLNENPASNPYTDQIAQSISNQVLPQVSSQFEKAGRYGSQGMAQAAGQGISNALAPQLFGSYNTQSGQQVAALAQTPYLNQMNLSNLKSASDVGATQQQQLQNLINSNMARYNYNAQLPYQNLNWYSGLLNGQSKTGGQTSTSTPYYQNQTAGMAGGAMAGAAMGSTIMPGWGTAIGAVAGGLLGGGYL